MILLKAQITRKKINLPKLFFVNEVRAGTSNSLQYLIWLNSKTVKIYLVVQSVKLLLALSIVTKHNPISAHCTYFLDKLLVFSQYGSAICIPYEFNLWMKNSVAPDQLASDEAS